MNQTDLAEKSRQVEHMGVIYLYASTLSIWIGPEEDDSDLAMQLLKDVGSSQDWKMPILTPQALLSIEALLSRGWWYRIWVIQEFFYGSVGKKVDDVLIQCGQLSISWISLKAAVERMVGHRDDHRKYFPHMENVSRLESLRNEFSRPLFRDGAATALLVD
jgi:hypothetical protein